MLKKQVKLLLREPKKQNSSNPKELSRNCNIASNLSLKRTGLRPAAHLVRLAISHAQLLMVRVCGACRNSRRAATRLDFQAPASNSLVKQAGLRVRRCLGRGLRFWSAVARLPRHPARDFRFRPGAINRSRVWVRRSEVRERRAFPALPRRMTANKLLKRTFSGWLRQPPSAA